MKIITHLVNANLDVEWFLPGAKRRFATSTTATSDLIVMLAENETTVADAIADVHHDPEAVEILTFFCEAGYGDILLADLVISDGTSVWDRVSRDL